MKYRKGKTGANKVTGSKVNKVNDTSWKVSKYGVFSGTYFPVFSPNTGKNEPEKTPYLDAF